MIEGTLSRRGFLAAAAVAAAGAAGTRGAIDAFAAGAAGAKTAPITVYEWAYYQKDFKGLDAFFKKYGYPKYVPFNDDQSELAKAASGAVSFDIAHPCIAYTKDWKDAGLIQALDTSKLPGLKGLNPAMMKGGEVDGKQYAIPWDWGFSAPLYRTDKVQPKSQSWEIIFDKRYKGKISLFKEGVAIIKIGGLLNGVSDPNAMSQTQINKARDTMIKAKANIRDFWDNEPKAIQDFLAGDVWITYAWPDTWAQIDAKFKPGLVYMSPKEGALAWVCCFVLGSKVQNPDVAYAYLNTALSAPAFLYLVNVYATGGATVAKDIIAKENKAFVKQLHLADPKALRPPRVWLERHLDNRNAYLKAFQQVLAA